MGTCCWQCFDQFMILLTSQAYMCALQHVLAWQTVGSSSWVGTYQTYTQVHFA